VRLATQLGGEHLSTGAVLRAEIDAGTARGEQVAAIVSSGALVPDVLMADLALPRVEAAAARGGYVLDGFPRSTAQAGRLLGCAAPPTVVVVLDVPEDELAARIQQRAAAEGRADDTVEVATR
jgi:adenylate kinase